MAQLAAIQLIMLMISIYGCHVERDREGRGLAVVVLWRNLLIELIA